MRFASLFVLVSFMLLSCHTKKYLTANELMKYPLDPEHGLYQVIKKNGMTLEMIYRPKDLIISQELEGNGPDEWDIIDRKLDSLDYFIFRLSMNDKEIQNNFLKDREMYAAVISYLSGNMAQDITLEIGDDKIQLVNLAYVPAFGSSNTSDVLLVFNSSLLKRDEDFSIVFNDGLFKTGRNEFEFQIAAVKATPKLQRE